MNQPDQSGPEHPSDSSGSERSQKRLQKLIAENPDFLRTADDSTIRWKSPIGPDYTEFRDRAFLKELELSDLSVPLSEFWPNKGPQWDGLGIGNDDQQTRILVEAKAYIEEADTNPTGAKSEKSKELIERSLTRARESMKATVGHADWSRSFYQYANRLAHLYFLEELNSIRTELWFIYFCDLPEEPQIATSLEEWEGALRLLHSHLGLGASNPLRHRIRGFFIDASTLELLEA